MGKTQHRRKIRLARETAAGAPSKATSPNKKEKQKEKEKVRESKVQVLEQLQSSESSTRLQAAQNLAALLASADEPTKRLLLGKNTVGILITRLKEDGLPASEDGGGDQQAQEERITTAIECLACLCSLAVTSDPSLLAEMHNKTLLPPFLSFVSVYRAALQTIFSPPVNGASSTNEAKNARKDAQRIARGELGLDEWLTLGWSLAESSPKSLSPLSADNDLSHLLFSLLNPIILNSSSPSNIKLPISVVLSSAHFIYALSEEGNEIFNNRVCSSPELSTWIGNLQTILRRSSVEQLQTVASDLERETLSRLGVLCAGILKNLAPFIPDSQFLDSFKDECASNLASRLQGTELVAFSDAAVKIWKENPEVANSSAYLPTSLSAARHLAAPPPSQLMLEAAERQLYSIELTLEVLGEICSSLDDLREDEVSGDEVAWEAMEDEDEDDDSDEAPGSDVQMDEDEKNTKTSKKSSKTKTKISNEVLVEDAMDADHPAKIKPEPSVSESFPSLLSHLPETLLKLAQPTSISFASASGNPGILSTAAADGTPEQVSAPPVIIDLISSIHSRALECLNNLLIVFARSAGSIEGFIVSNQRLLQNLWEGVFRTIEQVARTLPASGTGIGKGKKKLENKDDLRLSFLEAGAGCIWALARAGIDTLTIGQAETPFLLSLAKEVSSEPIKIRCIGALGSLATRNQVSEAENETIGSFLLQTLAQPGSDGASIDVVLQGLDAFIDVYSDETRDYDVPVFRQKGFLEELKRAEPSIRKLTKGVDKRKFPELRMRGEGCCANLKAFVEYRAALV